MFTYAATEEVKVDDPTELENAGWAALCAGRDPAVDFYRRILTSDVVMLFPGGTRLSGSKQVLDAIEPEWAQYEIEDLEQARPAADVAVLTYVAKATRRDGALYEALISSTYVHTEAGWRLAVHHQTPVT